MDAYEPLRLFVHLAGTLHFGETARACHVSPSALSRAIQRLEDELSTTLLLRDRRGASLTADGRRFLAYACDTLDRWERFDRSRTAQLSGTLAVFCTVTAAQSVLPPMLARFRESHPEVHIRLETGYAGDALAMLDAGMDVTVAALPDRLPRNVVARTLTVTPLVLVAPTTPSAVRSALERRRIDWGAVPLVVPPPGVARQAVDRWFRERGLTPDVYSEVASHEGILSLVSMGCGVGVVPMLVLEKSALRDALRVVDVRPSLGDLRVGVCVRRRKLGDPIVVAFWETVGE